MPSTQLAGALDYAIEIKSSDPTTQNFSALFKISSNGPGIKGTTVVPTTTRPVASYTGSVAKYTGGSESANSDESSIKAADEKSGSGNVAFSIFVAGAFCMVSGVMLAL